MQGKVYTGYLYIYFTITCSVLPLFGIVSMCVSKSITLFEQQTHPNTADSKGKVMIPTYYIIRYITVTQYSMTGNDF